MDKEQLKKKLCNYIDKSDITELICFIPAKLKNGDTEIENYFIDSKCRRWDAQVSEVNYLDKFDKIN